MSLHGHSVIHGRFRDRVRMDTMKVATGLYRYTAVNPSLDMMCRWLYLIIKGFFQKVICAATKRYKGRCYEQQERTIDRRLIHIVFFNSGRACPVAWYVFGACVVHLHSRCPRVQGKTLRTWSAAGMRNIQKKDGADVTIGNSRCVHRRHCRRGP